MSNNNINNSPIKPFVSTQAPFIIDSATLAAMSPAEQLLGQALIKIGRWQLKDEKKAGAKA